MKAFVLSRLTASCAVLALFMGSTGAKADELPLKGDFKITYTLTNPTPIKPITTGKDTFYSVSTAIMAAFNEAGGGLLHNMAGRCSSMALVDNGNKTSEAHGYCDYVDADGSHVFEKWDNPTQAQGVASHGIGTWIGGTGKYEGITGTFEIHARRLTPLADGVYQVIGEKVGSYMIEKVSAAK